MNTWGLSEWGDVANIVIAIASVATAIVTARMLIKQHKLQLKQHSLERLRHSLEEKKLKSQQQEHQPRFQFSKNDDSYIISNTGCEVATPVTVEIYPMITIQTQRVWFKAFPANFMCCYPVLYYKPMYNTNNLKGDVVILRFNMGDYERLLHIKHCVKSRLCENEKKKHLKYVKLKSINISDVVKINYVDIYNEQHTAYFWDSKIISEKTFMQLTVMRKLTPIQLYSIDALNVDDIVNKVYNASYPLDFIYDRVENI